MKKNLLITIDFPPMFGGVANYWANLLKYLPHEKVVVLSPEYNNSLDFDIEQNYLIYRKNLILKEKWVWPKWLPFLFLTWRLVAKEKIEQIMVAHILPGGTIAYLMKIFYNIPYVLSFHGLDIAAAQGYFRKKKLMRRIIKNADKIIANSNYTKTQLVKVEKSAEGKTTIIYPCPNLVKKDALDENLKQKIITTRGLENARILLTVGRLVERKGVDKVLDALPLIIKRIKNLKYVIVGRGDYKKELVEIVRRLKLEEYVMILEDISDEELLVYYHIAEVFAMLSRKLDSGDVEGFGIVYLEASSFGLPIVAGKSGGIPEAVVNNQTGLLVDPLNINEIAGAISMLFENKEKAAVLGKNGAKRAEEFFRWEKQSEKLKSVLN